MSLILFSMNYVSTSLISKLNDKHNPRHGTELHHKLSLSSYGLDAGINLKTILMHKKASHLFMVYLSSEYSMECLLSLIEFNEYQQFCMQYIVDDNVIDKIEIIPFPSNIPTSSILEETEYIPDDILVEYSDAIVYGAKIKAHKLYKKYIKTGSEFEINIGSDQRE
eukprot:183224_1